MTGAYVLALMGAVGGVGLAVCGRWLKTTAIASLSWPSTDGTIDLSYVSEAEGGHSAQVRYSFNVGGRNYQGASFDAGVTTGKLEDLIKLVEQHPPGSAVRVYYNPRRPADAVLKPGGDAGTRMHPVGIAIALSSLALLGVLTSGFIT